MRVSEVCTQDVVCVNSNCTVYEAAGLMRERHVGALVVVRSDDPRRAAVGLITDRDIAISVVAAGVRADVVTVGDVMSLPVYSFDEDGDLFEAIRLMRDKGVRRLVITGEDGELTGILAVDDAYAALTTQLAELKRVVEREQVRESALRS